jgi:hypothetical protein
MRMRWLAAAISIGILAWAQSPAQAPVQGQTLDLQAELRHLAALAQALQHDLPSFSCQESALSQTIRKKKVRAQVRFAGELRVEREDDGRLHEQLQVSEVNGKPHSGDNFARPIMVEGGFDASLDFFLPERQPCFHFTLGDGRVDFESPPGTIKRPGCEETGAPRGFVLFDGDGNVTHIERDVPAEYAAPLRLVDFSGIDFAWTELDGKKYPLSAKVVADVPREDDVALHFEATYAGCHLFKATSRILPGITPVPESKPAAPHP